MNMKTWKMQIELSVADSWIADGFDASERIEEIQESMCAMLPYANENEIQATVTIKKAPLPTIIEKLQNGELEIKD